jgi:hypothetical protein
MGRDDIARRLRAAAPAAAPHPADDLLPAIRYATCREPDAGIDVARSKLGGAPDLAQGAAWPLTEDAGERRPLQFVAQVDLAEANAAAPGPLGLPTAGLLSFFVDLGVEGGSGGEPRAPAIVYTPTDVPIVRRSLRLAPLPTAQLAPIGAWSWPGTAHNGLAQLAAEYDGDLRVAAPERFEVGAARHQLGGHIGSAPNAGLMTLLQVDSDPSIELAWGEDGEGRMVWTLPRDDFAAGRWSAFRVSLRRS